MISMKWIILLLGIILIEFSESRGALLNNEREKEEKITQNPGTNAGIFRLLSESLKYFTRENPVDENIQNSSIIRGVNESHFDPGFISHTDNTDSQITGTNGDLCTQDSCFEGGKCSDIDGSCYCEETEYFKNGKCNDAKCSLKDFKKTCKCPTSTTRKNSNEECEPKHPCTKECGYGICTKSSATSTYESCKCFEFSILSGGKCTLYSKFCEGNKLLKDLTKCKCEGQYIQADDGITCKLKTCKDEAAKLDCNTKGAKCKMNWKKGYYCECPDGQILGKGKKCPENFCEEVCGNEDGVICEGNVYVKKETKCACEDKTLNFDEKVKKCKSKKKYSRPM